MAWDVVLSVDLNRRHGTKIPKRARIIPAGSPVSDRPRVFLLSKGL